MGSIVNSSQKGSARGCWVARRLDPTYAPSDGPSTACPTPPRPAIARCAPLRGALPRFPEFGAPLSCASNIRALYLCVRLISAPQHRSAAWMALTNAARTGPASTGKGPGYPPREEARQIPGGVVGASPSTCGSPSPARLRICPSIISKAWSPSTTCRATAAASRTCGSERGHDAPLGLNRSLAMASRPIAQGDLRVLITTPTEYTMLINGAGGAA